jgi:predicted  nucleic acid-binding Zn-ribbon protein
VTPVTPPPVVAPPAVPGGLQLNGPPQNLDVPASPGFTLAVTQPGEYQIDVMGEPRDAQLNIYQGDELVVSDSDSGEGTDARVIRFLQPGAYSVRVSEYIGRQMSARVQAQLLTPLPPAGTITPGQTVPVQVPEGPDNRAASRELTLTIAAPGMYQIDATSDADHDAQLQIIQNNAIIAEDSDSGGNRNARVRRGLAPGQYTVRVFDYVHRATQIEVAVALDPAGPPDVPPPPAPGVPPAVPGDLVINGPPQPLEVPAAPGFDLVLAQPGEIQLDAMGQPMDPQLYLSMGDQPVTSDSDSGDATDARIIRFMQPGTYAVRVMEYRSRPMTARLQAQLLPPLTPVGTIAPGQSLPVQVPEGPDDRGASREITLNIAVAASYQIDATSDADHDAQLKIIQNNAVVAEDSDSGGNRNARITQVLQPGTYTVRVYDYVHRAATITVSVAQQ